MAVLRTQGFCNLFSHDYVSNHDYVGTFKIEKSKRHECNMSCTRESHGFETSQAFRCT